MQAEQMEVDMDYEFTYSPEDAPNTEEELFQINELMTFLYQRLPGCLGNEKMDEMGLISAAIEYINSLYGCLSN
ncbi:Oidioi.mRNA.OKI2018_I69.XSR.g16173.t1.cds [Oikopleura dioica]|uniref:Oidioi.mRNA.OKI2018_I69.XSR.g16173.t1.cds n=1 Tax=Oikopleura dioica TaxID=34765 RepID=A0ABN7SF78_OIKDI|nr:Oidioi.mRNA.OKI2018_I69.XSR.g16173.t1.cds [Oikopleura dioica]